MPFLTHMISGMPPSLHSTCTHAAPHVSCVRVCVCVCVSPVLQDGAVCVLMVLQYVV